MLDAVLRRQSQSLLAPVAERLAAWRIRATPLTLAGFACGVAALLDIGHRYYLVGLALLAVARLFDALDGAVARRDGPSRTGAWLEQFLDLLIAAAVPFAFALAQPERALAAMFLMLGLVARAGALAGELPGRLLLGKTELFVAFALACILPDRFSIVAYAVGILCFVAAGSRVAQVVANPPP